jgi:predicted metal-dependent phosphoesterase TrpH
MEKKHLSLPVPYPEAQAVIDRIHAYGGIAVLAHPGVAFYHREALLDELYHDGIDGIEVFTTYHDEKERQFFKTYAKKRKLFISGGSDFHGSYKPNIRMGEFGMQAEEQPLLEPLLRQLCTCNE